MWEGNRPIGTRRGSVWRYPAACGHVALRIHGFKTQFCNTLHEGIHLRRGNFLTIYTPEQDSLDSDGAVLRTFFRTFCIKIIFQQK
jgi:hypothetical protein